jgi:putative transposase
MPDQGDMAAVGHTCPTWAVAVGRAYLPDMGGCRRSGILARHGRFVEQGRVFDGPVSGSGYAKTLFFSSFFRAFFIMSDYRRARIPGGTYFFTVNLLDRQSQLLVKHIDLFRRAVRETLARHPFHIDAWVVLPDHTHCVWTLPPGDENYSQRWRSIKHHLSRHLHEIEAVSSVRERGIWQKRFWEHTIRDDTDHEAHINYCYINPVKHGWVVHARDWPYSTFHRDVRAGLYPLDWAIDIMDTAGEKTGEARNG